MMEGLHWIVRSLEQRQHLIDKIRQTEPPFSCKIGPVHSPKTTQQIRYAHSLCNALAEAKDVSPAIAKRDAKAEYGVIVLHHSVITGDRTARLVSFADYSKQEMEGFLSAMEAHLSQENIDFTPSGEHE